MELSFKDLKKRDVVNVTDGKSFGSIVNLTIDFPSCKLKGISVPSRAGKCFLRIFDRSEFFIPERNIIKIGGDVILVNIKCGETCVPSVAVGKSHEPSSPCGCGDILNEDEDL